MSLTRRRTALLHLAFWAVYASFFFYQIGFGRRTEFDWSRIGPDFAFHLFGVAALSYLNYFAFLPRLLADKRLGVYLLRFLPVFAVGSYLFLLGKQTIIAATIPDATWATSTRFGVSVILSTFFIVIFVGLLRFVEDYLELESRRKELTNRQLDTELRFLRAQVNPHFLFNTLNNLYYLAVSGSPQTPEVIAKLAGLMRYLLHDSNHELVPLEREIEYMRNYIDLERLRVDEAMRIRFDVSGPTVGVTVVPLILITFLENAFKHGVGKSGTDGGSWIEGHLGVTDETIEFRVANAKVPDADKTVTETSGIGLVNVRRRLELAYPDQHILDVVDDVDSYEVKLKLLRR